MVRLAQHMQMQAVMLTIHPCHRSQTTRARVLVNGKYTYSDLLTQMRACTPIPASHAASTISSLRCKLARQ